MFICKMPALYKTIMKNALFTFDDVLIKPRFSTITSRSEVNLSVGLFPQHYSLPVISANMDTITGVAMARAMASAGGIGCLHRFASIEENIKLFQDSTIDQIKPMVSIGLGKKEVERAEALIAVGADTIVIDVAHGAQIGTCVQVLALREKYGSNICIIAGNVATSESIRDIIAHSGVASVDAFKVGIGPGSACTTRTQTGVGIPQLSAIIDCVSTGYAIIADGGMKKPGDVAKALGAGAVVVMLGGMFSGTNETPGEIMTKRVYDAATSVNGTLGSDYRDVKYKKYRGSASKESYDAQGKTGTHRTTEGESFHVSHNGPVLGVLNDIEGGVRSSMTYVNARNLNEFYENCEFIQITSIALGENGAHGKK